MGTMASQITSLTIVYSTLYSGADQRKHQSSASLAFVWGIHRGPVNSSHKWPVTPKMHPFDDVIMSMQRVLPCHDVNMFLPLQSYLACKPRSWDGLTATHPKIWCQIFTTLSWWCHQMETFSALQALCEGNLPVTGSLHKASDAELRCFLWSVP